MGVLEWDVKMRDYLKNNNWRYPIVSRTGETPEEMSMHVHDVVTLRDVILSFEDPAATVAPTAASTDVRIVSLTITEFGYRVLSPRVIISSSARLSTAPWTAPWTRRRSGPRRARLRFSASSSGRWRSATRRRAPLHRDVLR